MHDMFFKLNLEHAFPPADFILAKYGRKKRAWLPFLYAYRLVCGVWTLFKNRMR